MIFFYILISLIGVFALLGIVYLNYYNKLHSKKIRVDEAEVIIDETLRKRYDYIIRISDIVKSNTNIKEDYFKDFEALKDKQISNFDMDRKITEAINLVYKLKDDFIELDKNKNFKDALADLKGTDETLEAAKAFYNKYTSELNLLIKKFPSNVVARVHGFIKKSYFDGKNLDDDIVTDFKL